MNAELFRRIAAVKMPASALREVIAILADMFPEETKCPKQSRAESERQSAYSKKRRLLMGIGKRRWNRLRAQIFERDQHTCTYCGKKPAKFSLECDHVIPLSRGGATDPDNLRTACKSCNASKKDTPLKDWCNL